MDYIHVTTTPFLSFFPVEFRSQSEQTLLSSLMMFPFQYLLSMPCSIVIICKFVFVSSNIIMTSAIMFGQKVLLRVSIGSPTVLFKN